MWNVDLGDVDAVIERALAEDLAGGDITTMATVPPDLKVDARLVAKAPLVVCGLFVAGRVLTKLDPSLRFTAKVSEGNRVTAGEVLAVMEGNARAMLAGERTALNLMQRLSGVATLTRSFVDAAGGSARICDTRKTTPGLRRLQRYAVRCGGGHNHRNDLGSGVLVKENHIRCAGGVEAAVRAARRRAPHPLRIECEVTDFAELDAAIEAGADAVLLDNMDDERVRAAVARVGRRAIVEISGGVTLERVPKLAAAGVDIISVGALTHSAPAADISMLFGQKPK
ncbi:MAG: carboxylating nicotinate-nucleotide diphosphorylase [Myxococcales bacterium]|nr:carboxylating nicotinate-nucleotide diphosphorylase [Myxococcales bacterium]MCB9717065.1 carboxylating nicotinate-nucleotide diphosphorylase [Myxococcales bacterium]